MPARRPHRFVLALVPAMGCYAGSSTGDDAADASASAGAGSADHGTGAGPGGVDDGSDGGDDAATGAADAGSGGVDDTAGDLPPGAVTFAEHVAPIMAEHCWGCHIDGGIAPFPMQDYDAVAPLSSAIVAATASRAMPPWPLDASGACGSFVGERWLDDDELAIFAAWDQGGAPPGDLAKVPAPSPPPSLGEVSASVAIEAYTPQGSPPDVPNDDYRCFLVAPPSDVDTVLTAFEVHPGVPEMAHHIVVFALGSDAAVSEAVAKYGSDGRPGYTCFGGAEVSDYSIVAAWTPGVPIMRFPAGTGMPITGGRPLLVQMHYNLSATIAEDATAIDLQFDPDATPLESLVISDYDLSIPAGSTDHVEGTSASFGGDRTIVGAFPHMHQIGKDLRVQFGDTCLLDAVRYDFHWQETYSFATPVVIPSGSEVSLRCTYDATGRDHTTHFGEGSADEMCGIQLLALP